MQGKQGFSISGLHIYNMGKSPLDSLFTRYVEAGRLAVVRYGPLVGKTVSVVDFVDLKRVIVDGPTVGVPRQQIPIKWLSLTGIKCKIERGATEKTLKKALAKDDVYAQWEKTKYAKKLASQTAKKSLTDLDRFKLMTAQKKMSHAAKKALKKTTGKKK